MAQMNLKLSIGETTYRQPNVNKKSWVCEIEYCVDLYVNGEYTDTIFNSTAIGVSTCHPNDTYDRVVGQKIAFAKAEQKMFSAVEKFVRQENEEAVKPLTNAYDTFVNKMSAASDRAKVHVRRVSGLEDGNNE